MADKNFPRPYVSEVRKDPIMKYVDFDNTGVGANPASMPKDQRPEGMTIEHVGGGTGKGR